MIVDMTKVRILGPRDRLLAVALPAVQAAGVLHPVPCAVSHPLLAPAELSPRLLRQDRYLARAVEDADRALSALPESAGTAGDWAEGWPGRVRLARRLRRQTAALQREQQALVEERALIDRYSGFFAAFQALSPDAAAGAGYCLVLRRGDPGLLERLRQALHDAAPQGFELRTRPLADGETAAVVLVPPPSAPAVERALAEAQVEEVPVPPSYGGGSLAEAIPRMLERAAGLPGRIEAIQEELRELARAHRAGLVSLRRSAHDLLGQREALLLVRTTPRAFVLDGWVPEARRAALAAALKDALGDAVVVEPLTREKWTDASAPVVLSNPRLFRPFEELLRFMPLPRYGTVDPTPFLAVFFPMFFGLMLGDLGYGAALCALAAVLWRRRGLAHSLGAIAGACGAFSLAFGALFGELFGDLGHRLFGLHPLLFSREEALVPFLVLAVAVGLVHVLLGLVLGAISSLHGHRREALGRGVMALMVALVTVAILALSGVLPRAFFTPAVIALLAAFPALVILEGLLGPIELLAALGNVLSYARIMALGTASVMMAVVANRMVGAMGSAVVGALFALLFHLVNFALGLFGPTIHALRLQYVEFLGKFYSAGGAEYRPLRPWSTDSPQSI